MAERLAQFAPKDNPPNVKIRGDVDSPADERRDETVETVDLLRRKGKPRRQVTESYGIKALHERMSTQNLAGPMNLINAVNERIRLSATKGPTVTELASQFDISIRMLEHRYRQCLGKSVKSEIIRVRLEAVKDLLETSTVPLGEVAELTGFGTSANLNAAFKKFFGTTMRDWRHTHQL